MDGCGFLVALLLVEFKKNNNTKTCIWGLPDSLCLFVCLFVCITELHGVNLCCLQDGQS